MAEVEAPVAVSGHDATGEGGARVESPFAPDEIGGVLRPLGEATMLPARAYTDPDVFAFERDNWFAGDWVCVGRTSDVTGSGDWFVAPLGRAGVIVVAGDDARVRAFHNVCRHRGMMLLDGAGEHAARIRCPYHGWCYDVRGRLALAPRMRDVAGFEPAEHGLTAVRLEGFGGFLFVNLSPDGPALLDWLDDLPAQLEGVPLDELRVGRRLRYAVRANWKLLMENFGESYHFRAVHPQLERKTPSVRAESLVSRGPWQGGWMPFGRGVQTVSLDGKRRGRPLLRRRGAEAPGVLDYLLFPNLFLSLQPDYLLAYRLAPISHDETTVTCDVLFDPAATLSGGIDAPDVYDFWQVTNSQDFAICERQQSGVGSPGYVPGKYTPFEEGVHEFDKIVAARYADP